MRARKADIRSILDDLDSLDIRSVKDVYKKYGKGIKSEIRRYYDKDVDPGEKDQFYKDLYERLNEKLENELSAPSEIKVFLSHSHKDLMYVYCLALFLTKKYSVAVYIDALDSSMPTKTNVKTADKIRKEVDKSDKFIFVGTKKSFNSKWCNWELGLGDAKWESGNIAFFVMSDMKEKNGGYEKMSMLGYIRLFLIKNLGVSIQ